MLAVSAGNRLPQEGEGRYIVADGDYVFFVWLYGSEAQERDAVTQLQNYAILDPPRPCSFLFIERMRKFKGTFSK